MSARRQRGDGVRRRTGRVSRSQPGIARNSLAVAISGIVTGGLGLIYWIAVGRLTPQPRSESGPRRPSSRLPCFALFGNLGLGAYFERFLPVAGAQSGRLVIGGLAVGVLGGGISAAFLVSGPSTRCSPTVGKSRSSR